MLRSSELLDAPLLCFAAVPAFDARVVGHVERGRVVLRALLIYIAFRIARLLRFGERLRFWVERRAIVYFGAAAVFARLFPHLLLENRLFAFALFPAFLP